MEEGEDATWETLSHETFHQFIFYFYGSLSPHSWYNEGQGDYFAGAKMTRTYRITSYGSLPGGLARTEFAKDMALASKQGKSIADGALVVRPEPPVGADVFVRQILDVYETAISARPKPAAALLQPA